MSEKELRALESIEESALIKVFKTKRSCPRHLLYLDSGMYPARYQVHRQMLIVLQYILKQPNDSLLLRIFEVQPSHPTKGDWASNVKELLQVYSIYLSMTEIKNTRQSIFKALVKRQTEKVALKTLLEK